LALAATVMLSLYVLFWPTQGGPALFAGSDKVVHLGLFALLAGTARWRFARTWAVPGVVAVYAAISEVVQAVLLPARSGDLLDLLADLLGVAVGWLVAGRLLGR
jgi:VanZ family protein